MKKSFHIILILLFAVGITLAQSKPGTTAEAEAMVKKAIEFYKANGAEKAFEEVSNPKGKFIKGDLYIFVYDMSGKCVAHGGNAKQVGKDLIELKDSDGKAFVKERVDLAKAKGKGWQDYNWTNPVSKAIEKKRAYIQKADDYIFGCGAYSK